MKDNKELTAKRLFWLTIILITLSYFSYRGLRPASQSYSDEIMKRSYGYIDQFTSVENMKLTVEEELLLLHSYYNIQDYKKVIHLYQDLKGDISALPQVRREAFLNMVHDAERKM